MESKQSKYRDNPGKYRTLPVGYLPSKGYPDSGPSPIGHGPIELDSNIWTWLQRTPVAVAVVSLAVMCSYGPDKLLGAFE